MIIDESVPPPSHSLPCLSLSIASAVCYTPEFPSTKSSDLANKSYITMIKRYSTSLLGKVENHCISRNLERQAKLGCHLSKRRMQSYMATIRICWEAWNAMRLRTSLGKPWFSVMLCQETNISVSSSSRGVSTVLQSKVCFLYLIPLTHNHKNQTLGHSRHRSILGRRTEQSQQRSTFRLFIQQPRQYKKWRPRC